MKKTISCTFNKNVPQHELSQLSNRLSQQTMPEFQQIDSNDGAAEFINGFEKFTREIQDFIVTKDEQMQNLINDRRML